MATPNSVNPFFLGRVKANAYDAEHGKGICTTAVSCNGATEVDVFGTTNGFRGTITGILVSAINATSQTITIKGTHGTVATVTSGTTEGAVTGITTALSSPTYAIDLTGTMKVVSGNSDCLTDQSIVFITYKTDED